MTFRRWDIVSVPFPYIEGFESKRRPALIVSTDDFHRVHGACFAAMVTTARNLTDVRMDDIEIQDLKSAGLTRPCVIRLARLTALEESPEVRRIGVLGRREKKAIAGLIERWFAI